MNKDMFDISDFYTFNKNNDDFLMNFSKNTNFGWHKDLYVEMVPGEEREVYRFNKRENGTVDEENIYNINELGLRGFNYQNPEIIAAGCSITYGVGIPEEYTWPMFLSKKLNIKILNFGINGYSISLICQKIMEYCYFNNYFPKNIFCFFPSFFRTFNISPMENKKLTNNLLINSINPLVIDDKEFIWHFDNNNFEYEEKINSSIHNTIFNSINSIFILEKFCIDHNINLVWTTWNKTSNILLKKLSSIPNFKLEKYKKFDNQLPNNDFEIACNLSHDNNLSNHKCWNIGSDYFLVNNKKLEGYQPHPGIHYHYHVADFFSKMYNG